MKVLTVFGTRPEAIKMAPVVNALAADELFAAKVCVTAQHREMTDQVLEAFKISPDFDLNLMRCGQGPDDIVSSILLKMRELYAKWRPDITLVHGDTATTMGVCLASYFAKITVGHVEAGLRSHNKYSPWPEEINRRIASLVADIHFAPTDLARENLLREGVAPENIHVTGNTVVDALLQTVERIRSDNALRAELEQHFDFLRQGGRFILVTGHRRENFGPAFDDFCLALKQLALRGDVQIVYPVHLNPNVQEPVLRILADVPGVHLTKPLGYLPFIFLMQRCALVITDSGGIQEEAPALGKAVLVTRQVTERPEGISANAARLVGTDTANIVKEAARLLDDPAACAAMSVASTMYGDGKAADRIVKILSRPLKTFIHMKQLNKNRK